MLILILIDVQYFQNLVFSFEKGSNVQNHFSGFCFFKKKLKGELALAYESYVGGILIVILIEILNDYCFILY